jgi:hypothetical protein
MFQLYSRSLAVHGAGGHVFIFKVSYIFAVAFGEAANPLLTSHVVVLNQNSRFVADFSVINEHHL